MARLGREFYVRDALSVAPELIGKRLVHRSPEGVCAGRIVEVEAYLGPRDKGAHSYRASPSGRTRIQYEPGGHLYIALTYGIHHCMNIVVGPAGTPEVVLLRALEPLEGIELMEKRRKTDQLRKLCSGPGNLTQALGITVAAYGLDLCGGDPIYLEEEKERPPVKPEEITTTPRINIDYAEEAAHYPWRFLLADSPFVSARHHRWKLTES